MQYPGLLRRFACLFYDALLLLAIFFFATLLFLALFGQATEPPLRYFFQLYLWAVAAVYFIWCWLHGGQTLPMQTWRIRLVNCLNQPVSLVQAVNRYILASLGLILFGAGFFWALLDRDGLFLHDRFSGTRLVLSRLS